MNVLVTGGGGFVGRHIVSRLLARGDTVRILGRRDQPDLAARGVEVVQADLGDPEAVKMACAGMEVVFHVAAKAGIWGDRAVYQRINVDGTVNVLAGCLMHGVRALVYTSTPSVVYGDHDIEAGTEELACPAEFLTAYAATKAMAEQMVLAANGDRGLHTCALRPHLIWGPGDTNLLPRLVARAKRGRLRQVGDGQNRISVSYVENTADAHLAAADRLEAGHPCCGRAYFINEPEPVNCWQFINSLLTQMGVAPVTRRIPAGRAYRVGWACEWVWRLLGLSGEPPMTRFLAKQLSTHHWFTAEAARRDLEWNPQVSIAEGLARLSPQAAGEADA